MDKAVDVVTIGESMVLFQPPTDGPLSYAPSLQQKVAGAESNVSIGLTRLGKQARWISRLGADPLGDFVLRTIRGEGVDTTYVTRDESAPTGLYIKEIRRPGADPNVFYYRRGSAASRMTASDVEPQWFQGARWLHVTGITPAIGERTEEMIRTAMMVARQMGLVVSFDPNLRRKLWDEETARNTLISLIPLCDVFLPGVEEAQFLFGSRQLSQYAQMVLDLGPTVCIVKLGAEGAYGAWQTQEGRAQNSRSSEDRGDVMVRGVPVSHVIDTVGAGDAFAAGCLSMLLDTLPQVIQGGATTGLPEAVRAALERGNQMGALAVQFHGDWEGLPTLSELERLSGQNTITR